MQTLLWRGGSVPEFIASSLKVFTDATRQPSIAVLYYADQLLARVPRRAKPSPVHIQLVAFNARWSVYCLNWKAVLAVSVFHEETLDLCDLDKKQLLARDIPLPKSA